VFETVEKGALCSVDKFELTAAGDAAIILACPRAAGTGCAGVLS